MDHPRDRGDLNSSQRQHLLTTCQYADKLLSEIEAILVASQSKSPFPKFKPDLAPAQAKVVQDYIARIRSQLVRILCSQDVPIPEPMLGSLHSIRVTLGFVDIAFDECRPKRMEGYGAVDPGMTTVLSGLADEIQGIISRLDTYLAEGQSADLAARLQRLEIAGGDVALVKALERAIDRHGLVEFRPGLVTILDRMESQAFEIAVFGRVSSGKSSLLNHIVEQDVLPVGVNPITAVPTRLTYGPEPRATAAFADRKPEQITLDHLAEFVTEQHNPGNREHVTRILVELPAARLREGVVYVDTPGLGGLATSGAAETRAYLPRCDLGVVLIDAGSTLTEDDLATIRTLCEAGITASVLLSKADLLDTADRDRVRQYVADHIRSELGLDLPVHAISIRPGFTGLLELWIETEILPLYDLHAQLARQSLNRKIGALRLGVEAALKAHLRRFTHAAAGDPAKLRELETELRLAAGKIAEAHTASVEMCDDLRDSADALIRSATPAAVKSVPDGRNRGHRIAAGIERGAAERTARIASAIAAAAEAAQSALLHAARGLALETGPGAQELADVLKSMPRFDITHAEIQARTSAGALLFGTRFAAWRLERQVRSQAGRQIEEAVRIYARVLQSWVRKTFLELQERFDNYADTYRAQLDRLAGDSPGEGLDEQALRDDLVALTAAAPAEVMERSTP